MLIGIHARNDYTFTPADYELMRVANIEAIKVLSLTPPRVLEPILTERPSTKVLVRLWIDQFGVGVRPTPQEFVERVAPAIQAYKEIACDFEIHNEPNHFQGIEGWGPTSEDALAFKEWYLAVLRELRNRFPWARFGFPGLAPGPIHNDMVWLDVCQDAIAESDWLGCHCYWQYDNYLDLWWGLRFRLYHELFPDKPIEITEFGDSSPDLTDSIMAYRYVKYYRHVRKYPYVRGAYAFIASSPDPTWHPFAWIRPDGSLRPVAYEVGAIPRAPRVEIEDITHALPRRGSYQWRDVDEINYIVVHHSATAPDISIERIAHYHVYGRGWPGIGYHFIIDQAGKCYRVNSEETVSFHVGEKNQVALGVCLLGNFTQGEPPQEQLDSLKALLHYLRVIYEVPKARIVGHHELARTICPGPWWESWKQRLLY